MGGETPLNLGEHFSEFVRSQVAAGRYLSPSEVVRAALRLLETQEVQRAALLNALDEGENSGDAQPFDMDAYMARRFGSTSTTRRR